MIASAAQAADRAATRLGAWLGSLHPAVFIALAFIAAIAHNGVRFDAKSPDEVVLESDSMPKPMANIAALSYGLRTVHWALGVDTTGHILLTSIVLTALLLILATAMTWWHLGAEHGRLLTLVILFGPLGVVAMGNLGRNDVLLLFGSVLVALAVTRIAHIVWLWVGLAFMIAGNPEQTVIALALALCVSAWSKSQISTRRVVSALAVSVAVFLALSLYARATGASNRLEYITQLLKRSVENFAVNAPLTIYSGYGVLWLLVIAVLLVSGGRERLWLAIGLIIAPLIITVITLDQTRVWVGITTLSVISLAVAVTRRDAPPPGVSASTHTESAHSRILGWVAALAVLFPAVQVLHTSVIQTPWEIIYSATLSGIYLITGG